MSNLLSPQQIANLKARAAASAREYKPPTIDRLDAFRPHPQADIRSPSLWHPYIPRAGTTLLAAPPGAGKSSVCLDLAARASNGHPMPDGSVAPETPGSVLIIAPEDPHHLVAQRLQNLHADPARIHFRREFPGDEIESLEALLLEVPSDIALIIIDPITSFLSDLSPGKLFNFASVSEEYNVPVLLTVPVHRPIYSPADLPRALGALSSYPRSILSIVPAPPTSQDSELKSQDSRLLLPIKTNAAALPPPVPFTLGPTLQWHPTSPDQPPAKVPLEPILQEAVDFLKNLLQEGPQKSTHILQAASQNLITRGTLYRAKKYLKIKSSLANFQSPWQWSLNDSSPNPAPKTAAT